MNNILKNSLTVLKTEQNQLNTLFFSNNNLSNIQSQLQRRTRQITGQTIGPQNCTDIVNIMQHFYANNPQYTMNVSMYRENNEILNEMVVNELLKMTVSGVKQYMTYIKDISYNREPIRHGVSTSMKGYENSEFPTNDVRLPSNQLNRISF